MLYTLNKINKNTTFYRSPKSICDLTNSNFRISVGPSAAGCSIAHESIRMRIHNGNVLDLQRASNGHAINEIYHVCRVELLIIEGFLLMSASYSVRSLHSKQSGITIYSINLQTNLLPGISSWAFSIYLIAIPFKYGVRGSECRATATMNLTG